MEANDNPLEPGVVWTLDVADDPATHQLLHRRAVFHRQHELQYHGMYMYLVLEYTRVLRYVLISAGLLVVVQRAVPVPHR